MTRLTFHLSMSLDGFVAGPNVRREEPLGDGGERLHDWMAGIADLRESHRRPGEAARADADAIQGAYRGVGALVMGRTTFDVGEGPWGDDPPFGMPVFVVTHRPGESIAKRGGTTYTFVTEGIEAALELARDAAGGRDLALGGGADLCRQCLAAGLVDDFQLHLVPVLLGGGVRLFDQPGVGPVQMELAAATGSPSGVTHLRFLVAS